MKKMKYGMLVLILLAGTYAGINYLAAFSNSGDSDEISKDIVLYRDRYCGCCRLYAQYLKSRDYNVSVVEVDDIRAELKRSGVPGEMSSCHISEIGGYVVVGHVPVEAIEKLLREKPEIRGISLPGMPSGSPGMPGEKLKPFVIYSLQDSGSDVFMKL